MLGGGLFSKYNSLIIKRQTLTHSRIYGIDYLVLHFHVDSSFLGEILPGCSVIYLSHFNLQTLPSQPENKCATVSFWRRRASFAQYGGRLPDSVPFCCAPSGWSSPTFRTRPTRSTGPRQSNGNGLCSAMTDMGIWVPIVRLRRMASRLLPRGFLLLASFSCLIY